MTCTKSGLREYAKRAIRAGWRSLMAAGGPIGMPVVDGDPCWLPSYNIQFRPCAPLSSVLCLSVCLSVFQRLIRSLPPLRLPGGTRASARPPSSSIPRHSALLGQLVRVRNPADPRRPWARPWVGPESWHPSAPFSSSDSVRSIGSRESIPSYRYFPPSHPLYLPAPPRLRSHRPPPLFPPFSRLRACIV